MDEVMPGGCRIVDRENDWYSSVIWHEPFARIAVAEEKAESQHTAVPKYVDDIEENIWVIFCASDHLWLAPEHSV